MGFTDKQNETLTKVLVDYNQRTDRTIPLHVMEELVEGTKLTLKQVMKWFENKRRNRRGKGAASQKKIKAKPKVGCQSKAEEKKESEPESKPKPKKVNRRTPSNIKLKSGAFSPAVLTVLLGAFDECSSLNKERRSQIATDAGLTPDQVTCFFKKERKRRLEAEAKAKLASSRRDTSDDEEDEDEDDNDDNDENSDDEDPEDLEEDKSGGGARSQSPVGGRVQTSSTRRQDARRDTSDDEEDEDDNDDNDENGDDEDPEDLEEDKSVGEARSQSPVGGRVQISSRPQAVHRATSEENEESDKDDDDDDSKDLERNYFGNDAGDGDDSDGSEGAESGKNNGSQSLIGRRVETVAARPQTAPQNLAKAKKTTRHDSNENGSRQNGRESAARNSDMTSQDLLAQAQDLVAQAQGLIAKAPMAQNQPPCVVDVLVKVQSLLAQYQANQAHAQAQIPSVPAQTFSAPAQAPSDQARQSSSEERAQHALSSTQTAPTNITMADRRIADYGLGDLEGFDGGQSSAQRAPSSPHTAPISLTKTDPRSSKREGTACNLKSLERSDGGQPSTGENHETSPSRPTIAPPKEAANDEDQAIPAAVDLQPEASTGGNQEDRDQVPGNNGLHLDQDVGAADIIPDRGNHQQGVIVPPAGPPRRLLRKDPVDKIIGDIKKLQKEKAHIYNPPTNHSLTPYEVVTTKPNPMLKNGAADLVKKQEEERSGRRVKVKRLQTPTSSTDPLHRRTSTNAHSSGHLHQTTGSTIPRDSRKRTGSPTSSHAITKLQRIETPVSVPSDLERKRGVISSILANSAIPESLLPASFQNINGDVLQLRRFIAKLLLAWRRNLTGHHWQQEVERGIVDILSGTEGSLTVLEKLLLEDVMTNPTTRTLGKERELMILAFETPLSHVEELIGEVYEMQVQFSRHRDESMATPEEWFKEVDRRTRTVFKPKARF